MLSLLVVVTTAAYIKLIVTQTIKFEQLPWVFAAKRFLHVEQATMRKGLTGSVVLHMADFRASRLGIEFLSVT